MSMNLSNLERANRFEVFEWLEANIKLTKEQISELGMWYDTGPFYFFKRKGKKQNNMFWRLSIIMLPIYYLFLFMGIPFTFIFRGRWGYGDKFFYGFHAKWMNKINL
jgi:hypothetical protein